jgi:ribosomal protein S1
VWKETPGFLKGHMTTQRQSWAEYERSEEYKALKVAETVGHKAGSAAYLQTEMSRSASMDERKATQRSEMWTDLEDGTLVEMFNAGRSVQEVALRLGRTYWAVRSRRKQLKD